MKTIIALLIISFISSCSSNTEKTDEKEITINPDWNYKEVENEYLDSLLIDICSVQGLEFTDLYPVLDSISSDNYLIA